MQQKQEHRVELQSKFNQPTGPYIQQIKVPEKNQRFRSYTDLSALEECGSENFSPKSTLIPTSLHQIVVNNEGSEFADQIQKQTICQIQSILFTKYTIAISQVLRAKGLHENDVVRITNKAMETSQENQSKIIQKICMLKGLTKQEILTFM